jgi:anti-sigma factor RsiW
MKDEAPGRRSTDMICDQAEILLHLLSDGEVDAGHARNARRHAADCPPCAETLRQYEALGAAMARADLRYPAPASLRARIESGLPRLPVPAPRRLPRFRGFALGAALSAAAAASVLLGVLRSEQDRVIVSNVVSAHLRAVHSDHLTDLKSGDGNQIRPWLTSRLTAPPPVADLSQAGIELVGARVDYVGGQPVAALVYRRGGHIINLFIGRGDEPGRGTRLAALQGVNVEIWSAQGMRFCAVADLGADAIEDFRGKFEAAARAART